jgi:hypothetical protein
LTAVKDSSPPVPEDHVAREVRRLSMAREKREKDAAKMRCGRRIRECEALLRRCRQQWLEGLPEEESPVESVSEEESNDNDTGSQYKTTTFLMHLPDVRSRRYPSAGGSTSQASRAASAPVEGEEDRPEERAHEGPLERRSAEPGIPLTTFAAPRTCTQSPRTLSAGGAAASMPEAGALSPGIRTRGQVALMTQRTLRTSSAQARGSSRPTRGSMECSSQGALGSSGKPGTKPLNPMSG